MDEPSRADVLANPDRLRTLGALGLLDGAPDPAFDRLTQLVARLLGVPVSLITLVDPQRQRFISAVGLPEPWQTSRQLPLSHSFCQHVVTDGAPFVVTDTRLHPRVSANLAIPDLGVIAYAGVPLRTSDGQVLGALCAIGHQPREWAAEDLALMQDLAAGVMTELRLRQALSAEQQARQRQQHAEASLAAVLAHVPDMVWSVDRSYRLSAYNPAYAELFQRLNQCVLEPGLALEERQDPDNQALWRMRYDRALGGETFTEDVRLDIPGEPGPSWYELSFAPVVTAPGVQGVTVVGRDVTSRRGEASTLRRLVTENARLYADERAARLQAEQAAERTARLYDVTAVLAQARTPAQVAEVVVRQGIEALGAYAGSLMLRQPDDTLHLVKTTGYPPEVTSSWPSRSIADPFPIAEAIREGRPVWLPERSDLAMRYPGFTLASSSPTKAIAVVPLLIDGRAIAAIGLSFRAPQVFPDEDRAFMLAVADQCAQALDRARLLESLRHELDERQRAEAALRASEARFAAFMHHIPAAAWICEADGALRYHNAAYTTMFGPVVGNVPGQPPRAVFHPAVERGAAERRPTPQDGEPVETSIQRADGSAGQFIVYHFPLPTDDSLPLRGGVAIDITERAAAEDQQRALERSLLETQKLESLGVLAGGIAHDFNNLLMAILGNAELALMELNEPHPARATVLQIRSASQQAADLTGQMLAYSGRGQFVVAPLDLNGLVEELALLLRVSTPKGAAISYALDPALPAVEADAAQLRQVVMNLVINGAEAIEGGEGTVTIRTLRRRIGTGFSAGGATPADLPAGEYVAVEVRDTGCGMDRATLERIFEPFFTTKFAGRGLGLAAVQGIVRAHKGTTQIDSRPGQGTTVTVLLPASTLTPATRPAAQPQPPAAQRMSVLVIDDEPEVRKVTARMLERLGFAAAIAPDGAAGIARIAADPEIAAVLLDLTMPGLSGEETLRGLRGLRADIPVVVVSGYSAHEVRGRVAAAGVVDVLQKPFTPAALREVLLRVLGQMSA